MITMQLSRDSLNPSLGKKNNHKKRVAKATLFPIFLALSFLKINFSRRAL